MLFLPQELPLVFFSFSSCLRSFSRGGRLVGIGNKGTIFLSTPTIGRMAAGGHHYTGIRSFVNHKILFYANLFGYRIPSASTSSEVPGVVPVTRRINVVLYAI